MQLNYKIVQNPLLTFSSTPPQKLEYPPVCSTSLNMGATIVLELNMTIEFKSRDNILSIILPKISHDVCAPIKLS